MYHVTQTSWFHVSCSSCCHVLYVLIVFVSFDMYRPSHDPWTFQPYDRNTAEGRRAGTPLCGVGGNKYFAFPFVIRGDLDWVDKTLKLADCHTKDHPCSWCGCNETTRPWRDFRRLGAWSASIFSDASWRAERPRNPRPGCKLFALEFISILAVCPDWMHNMHLGIMQYVYGSVLWLLTHQLLNEGSPKLNLQKVMADLRLFWRRHPTPGHYQGIGLSMFGSSDSDTLDSYPKLKGTAGEIKRLTKGLHSVFITYRFSDKPANPAKYIAHKQIGLMISKFGELDDILDQHPAHMYPRLPAASADAFTTLAFESMGLLTAVANYYISTELLQLFNATIKCHMMLHGAINARFMNPRLAICYGGEDYMHHMKRVVGASIRGTNVGAISGKMTSKIRSAMHLEMLPRHRL